MSGEIVIRADGLGKAYMISHAAAGRERYVALRDVLAEAARGVIGRIRNPARGPAVSRSDSIEEFWALKDISFEVKRGEVLGVVGRNGAGKSTLLKVLSRITEPTRGRVEIKGRLASLLEVGTGFHPELTGRENIFLNGAILGMTRAEIRRKFDEIVAFAEVEPFLDTPVKRYSSGMYVRLAFAIAAHLEPEILVVDEVLAVGDAEFQKKCLGKMQDVAGHGRTVLFVSHQMATIAALCDSALLLEKGRVKLRGSVPDTIAGYVQAANYTNQLLTPSERRGNGWLRLDAMELLDENGKSVASLYMGRNAIIKLSIRNMLKKSFQRLSLCVGASIMGQRVTTWSTSYSVGEIARTPDADFKIILRLPRLSLMPGRYDLNFYLTINDEIVDWLISGATLDVEALDYFGTGKIPSAKDAVFVSDHSFEISPN
ncbi:MAG: ABC transporter ATP-binding protein [Methylocystis sp.]